jgi:hypothetical protein
MKQSSNENQNINKSQNVNQAKERIERVESEAQSLGSKDNENGRKTWEKVFRSNKKGKINYLHLKIYENGPFSIHLKVEMLETPISGRKNGKEMWPI